MRALLFRLPSKSRIDVKPKLARDPVSSAMGDVLLSSGLITLRQAMIVGDRCSRQPAQPPFNLAVTRPWLVNWTMYIVIAGPWRRGWRSCCIVRSPLQIDEDERK